MKETKELLLFAIGITNAAFKAAEDGKVGVEDLLYLWPVLTSIGPAFGGLDQVPVEFGAFTEADLAELNKLVKDTFDIADEDLERRFEMGWELALRIWQVVQEIRK